MKRLILIGWSGSKPKYMQKYIDMYKKIGYNDIKFYCPSIFEPIQATGLYNAIKLNKLYEKENHVHCFSGGYFLYLMSLLRNNNGFSNVPEKLIIDSGPIEPNGLSVSRFVKSIISEKIPESIFVKGIPLLWLIQSNLYYNNKLQNNPNYFDKTNSIILLDELNRRILDKTAHPNKTFCIYSETDKILDISYNEKLIKYHNWESCILTNGNHAQLIKEKEYSDKLYDFLLR